MVVQTGSEQNQNRPNPHIGCERPEASLVMIFKLAQSAEKGLRKIRGHRDIPEFIKGIRFIVGVNEHSINDRNSTTTKNPYISYRSRRLRDSH